MSNIKGGRGLCPHCMKTHNNVAYHTAHACEMRIPCACGHTRSLHGGSGKHACLKCDCEEYVTNTPKIKVSELEELAKECARGPAMAKAHLISGPNGQCCCGWDGERTRTCQDIIAECVISTLRTATQQKDAEIEEELSNLREQRELDEHRIDKLTAENAELRKDKERLEWLGGNTLKCLNLKEPLRDTIDAARNAE